MKKETPFKKVKIVATVRQKEDLEDLVKRLLEEGANVFRLNCSHETPESFRKFVRRLRVLEKKLGVPLPLLADIPGPKIRIGHVDEGVYLKVGDSVTISKNSVVGSQGIFSVNYPKIIDRLEKGNLVYLGDADVELEVEKKTSQGVMSRVTAGGAIRSRMGFSAHGLSLDQVTLTQRDRLFIKAAKDVGADFIALSFVQTARDVQVARRVAGNDAFIIVKIETAAAVKNIEEIIKVVDGVMVARGDLGFSIPLAEVPLVQKKLISLSLKYSKPVITATQMLESMIHNRVPTRAEVTDVANAVLDGTDALMLSAETALGQFPDIAVRTMTKIIHATESRVVRREFSDQDQVGDAVAASVVKIAKQTKAKLIVAFSETGSTVRLIARHRAYQPMIALTPNRTTLRQLELTWGVEAFFTRHLKDLDSLLAASRKAVLKNPVISLKKGDRYVISAGVPFGKSGGTNLVLIQQV